MHRRTKYIQTDRGVTALMTIFLVLALVGMAAMVVDIGYGYVMKREAQNGADAAALAAAGVYAGQQGSCTSLLSTTTLSSRASAAAARARPHNVSLLSNGSLGTPTCSTDGSALEISYSAGSQAPALLKGIFGDKNPTTVTRFAKAQVFSPGAARGLRPYAVCSDDMATMEASPEDPIVIRFPSTTCGHQSGNWYTTDCEWDEPNGTIDENTENGCANLLYKVPDDGNPATTRDQEVLVACADELSSQQDCLTANTGNINNSTIDNIWRNDLLGKTIVLPVFRIGSVVGTGSNAQYPIDDFAGVTVCAYHWQTNGNSAYLNPANAADPCFGTKAVIDADGTLMSSNQDWLILAWTGVQVSGPIGPSGCSLQDCNVRAIRLVK